MAYTLVLGSKNLSSWSLRPYLALRATGAAFDEIVIQLDQPDTKAKILAHSPAGKVPVLKNEGLLVWDSLAICETLAERHPEAQLWPGDPALRAKARAYAAEMHSAFLALRQALPMDFARVLPCPVLSEAVKADIARIVAAWSDALKANPSGFLFGRFSVADCMYAPVVSRFHTYGVALPPVVAAYCKKMMALPGMLDWMAAAKAEGTAGWK